MYRRSFLGRASLIALAPTIPAFLARSVRAATNPTGNRILVVVQLSGGNDGVNTVVPLADDGYAKHRRKLQLDRNSLLRVNDTVGLHPSLSGLADLLQDDRLAIVQGVGYPNPNRSHDVSMSIWQTARFDPAEHQSYGWLGRAMDSMPRPIGGASHAMLVGDQSTPVALRGRRCVAASLENLSEMALHHDIARPSEVDDSDGELTSFVTRSMLDAYATSDLIQSVAEKQSDANASYPDSRFGRRLETIAGLIKSDYGTPVYYAIQPGYDTHAAQLPWHSSLLRDLSRSLKAFSDDLKAAALDDRVVVMCFSEFGRRVRENGSLGTDHGTAGPMFLLGPSVKAGLVGATPSLTDLVDGDLKVGIDFRSVYASLLSDWMGLEHETALGPGIERLNVMDA